MADISLSLRLPAEVDDELAACAKEEGKSKAQIARTAIAEWLADYADARDVRARENDELITGDELRKRLGI